MPVGDHRLPILHTKLHRPSVPRDLVERERLVAALEDGRHLPLTLVSAPAGYGKSTLVSSWLEKSSLPSAWLSLAESESDLRTFLLYFVEAVRGVVDGACPTISAFLDADELPPTPALADLLNNDLDALTSRIALVLDDYHRIREKSVHALLDQVLRHPPQSVHLVILSRRSPALSLGSLRANGSMNEIRMSDLVFVEDEATTFLERAIGRTLTQDVIAEVLRRTEGWAVGLRLASMLLRSARDDASLMSEFTGDARPIQEYLVEELIAQQTEFARMWLYRTSILERFCAALCEAVCHDEGDQLTGRAFLQLLEATGLLIVTLDERGEWFRFHHLFAELLKRGAAEELDPRELAALHLRAARWLEEHDDLEGALHHALEVPDVEEACGIVKRHRHELANREQWHRLERLSSQLPESAVEADAELSLLKAWCSANRSQFREMVRFLDHVERLIADTPTELRGEVDTLRALERLRAGRPEPDLARRALERLPPEDVHARSVATMMLSGSLQMSGDLEQAYRTAYEALEHAAFDELHKGRLLTNLCFSHWMAGDLKALQRAGAAALKVGTEHGLQETIVFGHYFQGIAHYHTNDLDAAEQSLTLAVQDQHAWRMLPYLGSQFALSLVNHAKGQAERARVRIESTIRFLLETGNAAALKTARAFEAELALRQGRLTDAVQWAQSFTADGRAIGYAFFVPELALVRVRLAQRTRTSLTQAGRWLAELHEFFHATHNARFVIEVLALKAAHLLASRDEAGAQTLAEAIRLAERGPFVRLFADLGPDVLAELEVLDTERETRSFVRKILSASRPPPTREMDPLTRRELEVLGLLTKRLSNQEIGDELHISPKTVKRHVENIFGKLSVSSRREAAVKARELGIQ